MAVRISDLVRHNPWWRDESWEREDYTLRNLPKIIPRKTINIEQGKIHLIRGIRRAGKTVYLKMLIKELIKSGINPRTILYLSCDRYSLREVKNIIDEFRLRNGDIRVFLDEITYLKNWGILLKTLGEEEITTVATGSNPILLKKETELLPGRGIEGNEYYFNPLSFREFVLLKKKSLEKYAFPYNEPQMDELIPWYEELQTLLYEYLITGGFPEAVLEYEKKNELSESLYEQIIRLILGEISKSGKDEEIAREVLEYILSLKGGRIDYITIANEVGISHITAREYLSVLEASRVLYVLKAWDISKRRHAHRKQKKIVFQSPLISSALHVYLTGGDAFEFIDKNIEWIIENLVSTHVIWSLELPIIREKHSFAGFYYDKSKECDLVIKERKFFGLEVKYGKLERKEYPFDVIYISKDEIEGNKVVPASLYLFGLKKSERGL